MNTVQLLAWITCLLLSFFASVLAVRNASYMVELEKRLGKVGKREGNEKVVEMSEFSEECRLIRESLDNIGEEIKQLHQSESYGSELSEVKTKLSALQKQIQKLKRTCGEGDKQREE